MNTITLKAQRIISNVMYDEVNGETIILALFRPTRETIRTLNASEDELELLVELDDETGLWGNDKVVSISKLTVSEDGKAASVLLQRA